MPPMRIAHRTLVWKQHLRRPTEKVGEDATDVEQWWSSQSDAGTLRASAKQSFGMPTFYIYRISRTDRMHSYTCGAIWNTCHCTADDQAQRLQRLRDQAIAQDTAARAEAEELAAAILAVEEAERREAEGLARQEWLWAEAEAEYVAREAERVAKEAEVSQRREEERLTAIRLSFGEMHAILEELHISQQKSLVKRHNLESKKVKEKMTASQFAYDIKRTLETTRIKQANDDIIEAVAIDYQTALDELSARHEREHNHLDPHLDLQKSSYLDTRQTAIAEEVQGAQLAERQDLNNQLTIVMDQTRRRAAMNASELQAALVLSRRREQLVEITGAEIVARKVFAERMWFDWVVCRRRRILEEDEWDLIRSGLRAETYGYAAAEARMLELP